MEIFSQEEKEQIIKMAFEATEVMKRGIRSMAIDNNMGLLNLIDDTYSQITNEIADHAATNAFKAKGRAYVRDLTLETVDRLLKLE